MHIDDDNSDVEIEQPGLPTNAPQITHVAFEVKSHEKDKKPAIAECFSNMFGIGRFATGVLEGGEMVETINIYGIVVSMLHPSIGRLLLITTINLHTGETVCNTGYRSTCAVQPGIDQSDKLTWLA